MLNNVLTAPSFGPQAFLPSVVVSKAGTSVAYYQDLGSFTVAYGAGNVSASVYGDVGTVTLKPYSDGFQGYFEGNVSDFDAFDVWNANNTITGNVGGVSAEMVNNFHLSVWGVTNVANLSDFWNSSAYFGTLKEGNADFAISSTIVVETLEDEFSIYGSADLYMVVYYGQGTNIDIDASSGVSVYGIHMDGAYFDIFDSNNTRIETEYGNVVYHDQGTNTTIIDGAGNSTLFLEGSGQVLANGGEGDDTFVVEHQGTAVLAGGGGADEFDLRASAEGDTVILDYNEAEGDKGTIWLADGAVQLDLKTAMDVFGVENDDGSTTVNIGQGSITTYAPPTDDFMFV